MCIHVYTYISLPVHVSGCLLGMGTGGRVFGEYLDCLVLLDRTGAPNLPPVSSPSS